MWKVEQRNFARTPSESSVRCADHDILQHCSLRVVVIGTRWELTNFFKLSQFVLKRRTGRSCIVQSCRGEATADRDFLATHAGTHVYPTKHHYCQQTWPKLQRWLQHYNINTITCRLAQLDEQQWPQHLRQSKQWIAHSDVQYLRDWVHCRDHAAAAIFVYCPFLYRTVLKKTFGRSSSVRPTRFDTTTSNTILTTTYTSPWMSSTSCCSLEWCSLSDYIEMTRNMYCSLPHVSSSSVVLNIFRLIKIVALYLFGWFSVFLFLSVFCIKS